MTSRLLSPVLALLACAPLLCAAAIPATAPSGAAGSVRADVETPTPLLASPLVRTTVVHGVDLPDDPWLPGHRGVDLATSVGASVRAPADGTVTFSGDVAGRPVVVVTLDSTNLRTTLEPVVATVDRGSRVHTGQEIGVVSDAAVTPSMGHCAPAACLHWGLKRDEEYLDPLDWTVGWGPIRLKPMPADVS
ncbi:M23 family metallopeptidase [Demequina capsici]|uniref:M23 family metallopeptidase n=1 Tax=Demequina capsici TaxID=3075620 RepID=A0AA96FAQ0_9MICO|nr:M23 family metallopeptidase [Demequina sp. PMTSA13]WNM26299.1 M23 family metallopeptidase [Demequina sp. PMTSA13]